MDVVSAADGTLSLLWDVRPPVTIYAPSMWADTFSNFSFDDQLQQKYAEEIDALKQMTMAMLMTAATPLEQMILIDTLERMGLGYHFEVEIDHKLQQIYDDNIAADDDLFTTALRFRLLRQHRHHISCNVFEKFVDKNGKFEESLSSDAEGLLSLYEAAHVQFHDEKILQEAVMFTRHHLSGMESQLQSLMKEKVKRALEHPLHRDVTILYTRFFISIYENDDSRDELLLKLAKYNFNFLQNMYKNELSQLSRWWNKFDLKSKLTYTRDRLVEAYFWGAGYHYEPQYSYARKGVAKAVLLATIIDDTYDNYATLNEAQLFTQILDRWSMDGIDDELPDYMRIVYHFIMSMYEDYELDAAKQGKQFAAPFLKEAVQQLARSYNQELKWVMGRQMPSFQEYAKNSEAASCIYLILACTIPGVKSFTEETINWIKNGPKFVLSTAMMGRLWNDIGSSQRENKGGKMLTAVDCYMQQCGLSKQETLSRFAEEIEDKWKDVNEALTILHLLSYARMCEATYNKNHGDGYTDPTISEPQIASLFLYKIDLIF